jgi:hypothetical protein
MRRKNISHRPIFIQKAPPHIRAEKNVPTRALHPFAKHNPLVDGVRKQFVAQPHQHHMIPHSVLLGRQPRLAPPATGHMSAQFPVARRAAAKCFIDEYLDGFALLVAYRHEQIRGVLHVFNPPALHLHKRGCSNAVAHRQHDIFIRVCSAVQRAFQVRALAQVPEAGPNQKRHQK